MLVDLGVSEANIEVTSDAVALRATACPNDVPLFLASLSQDCFERYRIAEPISIAVDVSKMNQLLTHARDDDMCTWEIDGNRLTLIYESLRE